MEKEEKSTETPVPPPKIRCQMCGQFGGTEDLHPCPAKAEQQDDDRPFCNCCAECTEECGEGV